MNALHEDLQHTVNTTLLFIHSNRVSSKLIAHDFETTPATHGDVISVTLPGVFTTGHGSKHGKKVQTPLIQWNTVSFLINNEERSKGFADICQEYLEPCAIAMAECLDRSTLFRMAVEAKHRRGTPGSRDFMKAWPSMQPGQRLVVGPNAQVEILKSPIPIFPAERDGTALSEARITDGIWMDQNCPVVTTDQCVTRYGKDGISEVMDRVEIGDTSVMFDPDAAALACRPLPVTKVNPETGAKQCSSFFKGLSLRMTISSHGPDPETEEVYDRVTFDILTGVATDPERLTAIYS